MSLGPYIDSYGSPARSHSNPQLCPDFGGDLFRDDNEGGGLLPPAEIVMATDPGLASTISHDLAIVEYIRRADDRAAEQQRRADERAAEQQVLFCSLLEKVGNCFAGLDRRLTRLENNTLYVLFSPHLLRSHHLLISLIGIRPPTPDPAPAPAPASTSVPAPSSLCVLLYMLELPLLTICFPRTGSSKKSRRHHFR